MSDTDYKSPVVTRICHEGAVAMEREDDGVIVCSECGDHVELLPGAVVGREWGQAQTGDPNCPIPKEWEAGLWGLNSAVIAAVRGGWTDDEVLSEVRDLLRSHRQAPTE